MRRIDRSGSFKRDYKREAKGRHRAALDDMLKPVLTALTADLPLDARYRDHDLSGEWAGYRECHIKPDRSELYGRIAFNILISNDDDHLRNHAFVWDAAGKGWRLSPLYDVVPRPQVAAERFMHMSAGPQGRLATLDNLIEANGSFGLLRKEAAAIIDRIASVTRQWRMIFEELGVPAPTCDKVACAFRRPREVGIEVVQKTLQNR